MNKENNNEKYYWKKEDGTLIPVHELTDLHVCNIVMKFGKDYLCDIGHAVIAEKFNKLNKKYKFFDVVKENDAIVNSQCMCNNVETDWDFCK